MNQAVISILAEQPLIFNVVVAVLGVLVGSFLNVVIYRVPLMLEQQWRAECQDHFGKSDFAAKGAATEPFNLLKPDSHCPKCKTKLKPWHNIPLISYALQRGRCQYCAAPISVRYPLIELLSGVMSLLVAIQFGWSMATALMLILTWGLIALTFIDLDKMLLPDQITLPLLWLVLVTSGFHWALEPLATIWGAAVGYLALWSVYWLFKLVTGKEGMGYGDFKLLALIGAVIGAHQLPMVILLSSVIGLMVAIVLMIGFKHQKDTPIPFGPYLASAGWACMMWGDQWFDAYVNFLRS